MSHSETGRNDPCPCGSGKKFKRCCYRNRARDELGQDSSSMQVPYPVGTVAQYGPDDKTVTKLAAGIILYEDAEPIIKRWMATDITTNPKVQKELTDFFQEYGVNQIAMSQEIMGCPHEEGEDFPVGEDCPFCPFWKGKQG